LRRSVLGSRHAARAAARAPGSRARSHRHLGPASPIRAPAGVRLAHRLDRNGNLMSHPKIPNYEIMSIPRDPGHSHAYQVGIGVARTNGPATFGLDAVYEPIWSETYAAAAAPTETAAGDTIPLGGKTIENRFRFSNALFRMGVGRELTFGGRPHAAAWQLGLAAHAIHYR